MLVDKVILIIFNVTNYCGMGYFIMHGEMIHKFNAFDFRVRWIENSKVINFRMFIYINNFVHIHNIQRFTIKMQGNSLEVIISVALMTEHATRNIGKRRRNLLIC